jgi:enoyl-CoA hydratase
MLCDAKLPNSAEDTMAPTLQFRDDIALITLNRPEALNALSFGVVRDLARLFDEVAASKARALLITGAGSKAFCAGADIKELKGRGIVETQAATDFGQATISKLETLPLPSVAVINGYALGGGLELSLACTFRIAVKTARMGLPEIKLGLIPGYGGTQRLPRVIGEGRALDLVMTGRQIDAEEALRIGLVTHVFEGDAVEAGIAFARRFTGFGLPALRYAREAVRRAHDVPIHEGLKIESDINTLSFQTEDAREGIEAFEQKRAARFKDR